MKQAHDSFEILRDCRVLYLEQIGLLLRDTGVLSATAIKSAAHGAGGYFDDVIASSRRGSFSEEVDGLTSSRITLVGEDDLELELRLDNVGARLFEAAGSELWKTHQYFITVLKRPDLSKSNNPVGPNSITQGLKEMFADTGGMVLDKKLDLLDRIEARLKDGLSGLYLAINQYFVRQGIDAAPTTIVSTPDAAKKPVSAGGAMAVDTNLQALQQALMARMPNTGQLAGGDGAVGGSVGGGGAMASLLSQATLERLMFRLDELDKRAGSAPQFAAVGSQPLENLIPGLFSTEPSGVGLSPKSLRSAELGVPAMAPEALAIDTLALVFETIFEHPDLPDALKSIISSLQITMLKLAMRDSEFFTDPTYPARRLIDRMGVAMQGLPLDVSIRHPVCQQLAEMAAHIRSNYTGDLAIFDSPLSQLDALIAGQKSSLIAASEVYLPLLKQLDRRDQAVAESKRVLDLQIAKGIPESICEFVEKTWGRVLQKVWLEKGPNSSEWQAYSQVIDDLLWTFQPKREADDRKALARRLPEMLKLLKSGMDAVGVPADAQAAFLDASFALQTQALRASQAATPLAATNDLAPVLDAVGMRRALPVPVFGEVKAGDLCLRTFSFPAGEIVPPRPLPCQSGDWIEIQLDAEKPVLLQTALLTSNGQRAVFFGPDSSPVWAIHPALVDKQLKAGTARLMSDVSLFDAAAERALRQTTSS
jgi:hypothetical protein